MVNIKIRIVENKLTFQVAAIASLIPQFIIIGIIVQGDTDVPVLKWNSAIIIMTTVCTNVEMSYHMFSHSYWESRSGLYYIDLMRPTLP